MEIVKLNYLSRIPRFLILRLSMSRWLSSKLMRPQLLKMIGIKIGKNAHIGANVTFDTLDYRLFDIGDNVTITMNSVLLTHYPQISIIGANTVIAKPVTIGNNVVIAAGSIVTKDIPSNCLVGGVPAKVIKEFKED